MNALGAEVLTHLPASYLIGRWVFGGKSTRDIPALYRIEEGKGIDWAMTPMEVARSSWGPGMRRSQYEEDDDEDLEEDEFDDDDFDDDEFDDDDLFDEDEDLEDDEDFEDDEDEDLF